MPPLSIGQILNNRYRIDVLLGQGGMGAVYRAFDSNLNMAVAVKENLDASSEAQKQFVREAGILSHISHPNLPRVTDHFFVPDQGQYLVMDFVEGEDLQTMLDRLGLLPEPQVLAWVFQVCDALAYLHNQPSPIIHRDIKPANIKIRPNGQVMLVDFGIAKLYDPMLVTVRGARAVTPGYSPPEQYGTGTTDARSDIYALGATLYNLLTGQPLPESVQRMVGGVIVPPPRDLNPDISPATEQVILKAIAVATDNRFQSVEELYAALPQPGNGDSIRPLPSALSTAHWRPPSDKLPEPLPPTRRVLPRLLGLAGGAALAFFLGVMLTLAGTFRNIRQTQATVTPAPTQMVPAALLNTPTATPVPPTPTATPPIPTATPVPPSPTATPPAPTETPAEPTPELTLTPTLTPSPTPRVVRPQLVAPPWGLGPYRNPIVLKWQGLLSAGQTYQVTVYNSSYGYLVAWSKPLTTESWGVYLPDKSWDTGEYLWKVSVMSREGKELTTSPGWTFWFSPIGMPQPQWSEGAEPQGTR